jgi:hypothetical protein
MDSWSQHWLGSSVNYLNFVFVWFWFSANFVFRLNQKGISYWSASCLKKSDNDPYHVVCIQTAYISMGLPGTSTLRWGKRRRPCRSRAWRCAGTRGRRRGQRHRPWVKNGLEGTNLQTTFLSAVEVGRAWGGCYDHNFLRFLTIFGEKNGVFLKNQCYD